MRWLYAVLPAVALSITAMAQEAPEKKPQAGPPTKVRRVPTPAEAAKIAAADLATLAEEERPFQRYFLTLDTSPEFYGAFNYMLNTCLSHATTLYRANRVGDGHVVRVDLRRLWPQQHIFDSLFVVYEKLADIDPYFHVHNVAVVRSKQVKKSVKPYTANDGKTYDYVLETVDEKLTGTDHALHLLGDAGDPSAIQSLAIGTQSRAPLLRADWFLFKSSSSAKDYDGRYYQWRLFEEKPAKGTAEESWLLQQGVVLDVLAGLRSDQRVGRWRSNVTGKPRIVEYFYGSGTRASLGPALITITRDWFDGKIDAKRHPIANLLNYQYDGTESIGMLPNGMQVYGLFDGKGGLVDVAPQKLVTDRTVPAPHTANLQAPISCWRCHAKQEGWLDAPNDVLAFTKGKYAINIFDDESDKRDPIETLDRLAGLYSGDIAEPLRMARNTHAKATWIIAKMEVKDVLEKISDVYNQYVFGAVTPAVALRELGWAVDEAEAAEVFHEIVPPLPPNRLGVIPETIVIGTLRAWSEKHPLFVNRDDWEQTYADAMLRAAAAAAVKSKPVQEEQK